VLVPLDALRVLAKSLFDWRTDLSQGTRLRQRAAQLLDALVREGVPEKTPEVQLRLMVDGCPRLPENLVAWLFVQWTVEPVHPVGPKFDWPPQVSGPKVLLSPAQSPLRLTTKDFADGWEVSPAWAQFVWQTEVAYPDVVFFVSGLQVVVTRQDFVPPPQQIKRRASSDPYIVEGVSDNIAAAAAFHLEIPHLAVLGLTRPRRGRLWKTLYDWRECFQIGWHPTLRRDDLLAHLALLALRQSVGGREVHAWLARYAAQGLTRQIRGMAPAAVDHAVTQYVYPFGSLRRYLRRVAVGLAQEGRPPDRVAHLAAVYEADARTVYRWQRGRLDAPMQAQALRQRRSKAALERKLAEQLSITRGAARGRVERRLKVGASLKDIAREHGLLEHYWSNANSVADRRGRKASVPCQ